ncbi:hypothetical protein F0310_05395 (plasmid) [Borrelia sp. A-FGy1]|uniref:hypothetical protein n=1 Tax=Borrelia sp. A-FGy1 TaxID=2608247 RepID=UPI0015F376C7|nr:hypothetical protein [Borrelia sp. A-FGy1]QMU99849.1 hypothetical protein F0310_05395 [Borrelia sp. A-FGy1]
MNNNKIVIAAVFIFCICLCGVLVVKLINLLFGKDILGSTKSSREEDILYFRYKEKKEQESSSEADDRDI